MIIGVILARAGSKRIPGKNLKLLGGRPLIDWTLSVAWNCKQLSEIVVSSDSEEILARAEEHGAIAVKRPDDLAGDEIKSEPATLHAMQRAGFANDSNIVVLLQPTSPLRLVRDVSEAIRLYRFTNAPAVVSVGPRGRPNGAIYVISYKMLREEASFYPKGWEMYVMPANRSVDLDEPEDWKEAEKWLDPQMALNWDG